MTSETVTVELPKRLAWFDSNGEPGWVSNIHRLTEEEASQMADLYDFTEDESCETSWINRVNRELPKENISKVIHDSLIEMRNDPSLSPAMAYTIAFQKNFPNADGI